MALLLNANDSVSRSYSITKPSPLHPIVPSECGDLETTGEKAGQYKIPILSNSITTPIYLGEVETTRKIKKAVLTGTNADGEWKKSSMRTGSFYLNIGTNATVALGLCDRAVNVGKIEQYDSIGKMFVESSGVSKLINLWLFDTNISLDDFKSYLAAQYAAGTPVTVWYVLAKPETAVVNEPLMKIGDYADTIDSTQTSVQIPTAAGETTISWAGEGLAPSQFDSIQEWVDIPTYTRVNGKWVADN